MANFKCRVLKNDGGEEVVDIGADNERDAADILKREGRFVLSVELSSAGKSSGSEAGMHKRVSADPAAILFRAKKKGVILMIRQLAVLLESGISIVHALNSLERQSRSRGMRRLLVRIRDDIEAGHSLSDALSANSRVFKQYVISMVRAAESSGELDVTMSSIADKLEEEAEFRRQMITALIYPSILLIMSLVVVMLLGIFIIPKFAPMLEGGGKTVPWATQLVMDISDWIQKHWVRVLQVIFGTVVGLFLFRRTDRGGYLVDLFLLRIPVVGKVVQSGSVIAFSNNLAMLYASGVPISDALQTVRDTLANSAAAKLVDRMVDSILSGGSLVEPLRKAEHIFPPMVAEMLATGEETGELERALLLLGKIFKTMLNSFVKQMNALIEPLMILILGGIVGFVFYALITGVLAVYGV